MRATLSLNGLLIVDSDRVNEVLKKVSDLVGNQGWTRFQEKVWT